MTNVVVLDYGSGNLRSAARALETTGASVTISSDFDEALAADGLVVPGVGAFAACMSGLNQIRGEQIIERRLAGGRPVLGICVGMQIMFAGSQEHSEQPSAGLAQWPDLVTELSAPVLPH
ncbi:MAG: imidazole glycerol phosphate synthase subunit HisH, partial [Actinobacteria bacterium]|nr:imidazole glycerol phosphate synthase subunit HisH [Actinomycetota bacterium]